MTLLSARAFARFACWSTLAATAIPTVPEARAATHFVVIEGIGGTRAYAESFRNQVEEMLPILRETAGSDAAVHVLAGREATAGRIQTAFEELAGAVVPGDSLAVFLVGHGTHDGMTTSSTSQAPISPRASSIRGSDAVPAAPNSS